MISRNVLVFFKIVPEGHNNCQLSIVNCQFGEAAKQQFIVPFRTGKIPPGVAPGRDSVMDYLTYSMTTRRLGSTPVEWVVMFSMSCRAA